MKNRLTDLNDMLFGQLERIADEDLTADQLAQEIQRTSAVVQIADRIVETATLQLQGARLIAEHGATMAKQLPSVMAITSGSAA